MSSTLDPQLLEILRCPFCGGRLTIDCIVEDTERQLRAGVLSCHCCVFPVVDGIPHMRIGNSAHVALQLLGKGDAEAARLTLLGLKGARLDEFQALLTRDAPLTFERALQALCTDAEGTYLLHRFSDPTFLASEVLVRTVGTDPRVTSGRVLDLCGGAGHLTRALCQLPTLGEVVLADITFWKLWLAKRFVAPDCRPVCCDANGPLPFARESFSWVVCSDAFHYIWHKRLLADEMVRLVGVHGAITLAHLHNALCENPSAGNPLPPSGYRELFGGMPTRLLGESRLLDAAIDCAPIDLSRSIPDEELAAEPALAVIASQLPEVFREHSAPEPLPGWRELQVNPLYSVRENGRTVLERRFPSAEYAAEFSECYRYLPVEVELYEGQVVAGQMIGSEGELLRLARQHVLLDLPAHYLEPRR